MRVLITGSTSGIGHELAQQYLEANNHVVCCGRNTQVLEQLQDNYPDQVEACCFETDNYQQVQDQLKNTGPFDLVILNAGTCEYLDMPRFDAQSFTRVINTNVIGIANCLEALIPQIKQNGRLALVGSSASYLPLPRAEAYGTSKAATEYLAKTLSISLTSFGIKVTYIAPGFVKTPLTDRNDFPMPMRIDAAAAASRIIKGLKQGKSEIHFPRRFTGLLKAIGLMPFALQRQLIHRLVARH